MDTTLDAFLCSWPSDPWLVAALVLTGGVYLRGWLRLRRGGGRQWNGGQLVAFLGGLGALFLALASPIEPFAVLFLQAHMIQHLLLMMVVPPLLWLGAPLFPLLRGLPHPIRAYWIAPLFRSQTLRRIRLVPAQQSGHGIVLRCKYIAHIMENRESETLTEIGQTDRRKAEFNAVYEQRGAAHRKARGRIAWSCLI